ncbi:hypothetical protein LH991_06225 [Schleiferilactobacillus harbinensis]|nr:hypothetical protein [Schleiferilactobacillus harbinensis]MCT2907743.1 hypothetical protein [Schleiferilactobacillus harbinensis]QFR63592.1 hypothetical protein LH991_06225 [Schleiferilactobacillus harbinensis]
MWLGDLKTAVFAGFKRRHHVPAQFCRSLRSFGTAYQERALSQFLLTIITPVARTKSTRTCYTT